VAEGQGSKIVVYAALAGNLAIAVVKFTAAALTGSAAMLTEGVHSAVDSLDQVLLLIGQSRAQREPDESHPFGYGLEIYFWSFTVALMVFLAGGAFSAWEGWRKLHEPSEADRPWVNYLVLGVSFVFEGASFAVGWREDRRFTRGRVGVFRFIRVSKDPNLIVTLMEDGAALTGLVIAALGVTGQVFGLRWADGAASMAIGVLLMLVAAVLANETRSLIAGEAAAPRVVAAIHEAVHACGEVEGDGLDIATLQLGPEAILVALTLDVREGQSVEAVTRAITDRVREVDGRIARVYFRPTGTPGAPGGVASADGGA
jgi:cation diffusion facilitator family transporter